MVMFSSEGFQMDSYWLKNEKILSETGNDQNLVSGNGKKLFSAG